MRCLKLSQRFSFISMMLLTGSLFIVEIVVGYVTNSMALVADSFHMLSDVVSLIVGYMALKFTKDGLQTGHYTFGWARAEVLGALVNAVFLVALCFSIIVEALKRIVIPEELDNVKLVLVTGGVGLLVNIIGLFLFHQHGHGHSHGASHGHSHSVVGHGHTLPDENPTKNRQSKQNIVSVIEAAENIEKINALSIEKENVSVPLLKENALPLLKLNSKTAVANREAVANGEELVVGHIDGLHTGVGDEEDSSSASLNVRGVYLHVLGDALGSVIVMVSALIIMFTSGAWTKYVDPSLSIIMVLIILKTSLPLLKESSMILMQTVPTHIKIQEIQDKLMESVPGILSVHEFHIWQLAGNKIIASAHVHCRTLLDYMAIASQVKEFFHNQGIHSTTIQPEFQEPLFQQSVDSLDCLLECNKECSELTCCGGTAPSTASSSGHSNQSNKYKDGKVEMTEANKVYNVPV